MGDYLVQLSKILNLKAYVTASPKHHQRLKELGAEQCFDYKDPDVAKKIREASGGKIKYGCDTISENGMWADPVMVNLRELIEGRNRLDQDCSRLLWRGRRKACSSS